MKRQTIELHFLSDRFLKWVKINFTLTPIIPLTPIILTPIILTPIIVTPIIARHD